MQNVHRGPNPGVLAIVFTVLKLASLLPVTVFGFALGFRPPWFPPDTVSAASVTSYFATHSTSVLILAFLQFGSAIPLGLFTAAIVSRLRFLGVRAAGVHIALFGGLAAAFDSMASAFVLWVLARPDIAQAGAGVRPLHYLAIAFGGVGYAVPLGLLMAGVSVSGGLSKLRPKWIAVFGLVLAVAGELSWFAMITPRVEFLIPLVRFLGFVWLIAAGFALPKALARPRASGLEVQA